MAKSKKNSTNCAENLLKDRIRLNPGLWSLKYRKIRGNPFSFEGHEYLWDIYSDKCPQKYVQKSAQCGVSEYFINETFWLADQFRFNALFIFPADPQLYDFSHGRVKPAIEESEYLQSVVKGIDNVGLKRIRNAFVYYRGGQKARKLKSIDADAIYLDEVDEIPPASVALAGKRLGHSRLKWQRGASTPTYPEVGINEFMLKSDQRRWHIKCEHCNEWQHLTFDENVDLKKALVVCRKCKKPLDVSRGEWVAEFPGKDIHGYYINKLMCKLTDMSELIENSEKTVPEEVQEFHNSDLGETYVPKGGQLSNTIIDACRDDYTWPESARRCTAGIDVGAKINVRISEHRIAGIKHAVWIGTVDEFEELDHLMHKYDIGCAVIDALPETRKSREFCERFEGRAFMCYYGRSDNTKKDYPEGTYYLIKEDGYSIEAHRTMACDYMVDRLNQRTNRLPRDIKAVVKDYYKQLKQPIRVLETDNRGIKYASYTSNNKADHYFHAEVYDELATRLFSGAVIIDEEIPPTEEGEFNF